MNNLLHNLRLLINEEMLAVANVTEEHSGKAHELSNVDGAEIKTFNRVLKSTFT